MLDSNEGIVIVTSNVELLGVSLGTAYEYILGIDKGTDLDPVVSHYDG